MAFNYKLQKKSAWQKQTCLGPLRFLQPSEPLTYFDIKTFLFLKILFFSSNVMWLIVNSLLVGHE